MRVTYDGLYKREGQGERSFRWTNGTARIVAPREGRPAPKSLRVNLATAGPAEKGLAIRVNRCEVFEGPVPSGRWSRIFPIPADCEDADETVIHLLSRTHASPDGDIGVAVERLDLLDAVWPPPMAMPETDRRSQIRLRNIAAGTSVDSSATLDVTVGNSGSAVWPSIGDLKEESGAVRLGVLWFRPNDTEHPAAVQRVELPQTLVPGDSMEFSFQLLPIGAESKPLPPGEYEAWIGLMQEGVSWFYMSGDAVRKLRVIHHPRP